MNDRPPVNIDWSCCSEEIKDLINEKFLNKVGIDTDDMVIGDERLLQYLGVIMVEVYDEVTKNDE